MPKPPEAAAREFLEGLKTRKRQPWDDVAEYSRESAPAPAAKPSPAPARSTADDAMDQAERIAARNRKIAKQTRRVFGD